MPAPLPVAKILGGAFLVPWWRRRPFARALAIPFALLAALTVAMERGSGELEIPRYLLMLATYGVLFALFAVRCHRLVLLDGAPMEVMPRWTWREMRFLGWLASVWALVGVVWYVLFFAVSTIALNVWGRDTATPKLYWLAYLSAIPAFYVFARLSPVFPATAIDRGFSLRRAWRLTQRNGWRLVLVVMLLPWALSWLVGLLDREDATIWEGVVLTAFATALMAVEIAALSLSYRELTNSLDEPGAAEGGG